MWKSPATRNRTRDHLIAASFYSQMLYQLSYSRLVCERCGLVVGFILKIPLARATTSFASVFQASLWPPCLLVGGKAKSSRTQWVREMPWLPRWSNRPSRLRGGSKVGPCRAKHRGSCKSGSYAPSMFSGTRMPRVLIV